MTMHTVFFKEHQDNVSQNSPNVSPPVVPRWSGLGSQSLAVAYGNTLLELSAGAKHLEELGLAGKGSTVPFTLFSGDCKSSADEKTQIQTITMDYGSGHFELGFRQPLVCGKYPYADVPVYGVNSIYGAQIAGRIMLPFSMNADGGPIFVNAKQYHGIMRRRKKRAEAELENRVLKLRKPYLHLSRHLHAKRRPRGNGGRFLNTRSTNKSSNPTPKTSIDCHKLAGAGSQTSEVLQSNGGGNSKETNYYSSSSRSTSPISEVTSHQLFMRDNGGAHDHHLPFQGNGLHHLFQAFPVAEPRLGIAMSAASGNY